MLKTLSRVGNSKALILDKTLLELMGVDAESGAVEVQIHGDALVVRRAAAPGSTYEADLSARGQALMDSFDSAFRRLSSPQ